MMWRIIAVVALSAVGMTASAQPAEEGSVPEPTSPLYAIHPITVVGDEPQLEPELQRMLDELLHAATVRSVPSAKVTEFLSSKPLHRCPDNGCLAALAAATGADQAVRITVAPRARRDGKSVIVVTGKLVRPDGIESLSRVQFYDRGQGNGRSLRNALDSFVRVELALGAPELADLTPPDPQHLPPVAPAAAPQPQWHVPVALGAAAAAVIGAGVGSYFQWRAADGWDRANGLVRTGPLSPAERDTLQQLQEGARADQGVATGVFVVSGLAAGIAGTVWLLQPKPTPAAPTPAEASLGLSPAGLGLQLTISFR